HSSALRLRRLGPRRPRIARGKGPSGPKFPSPGPLTPLPLFSVFRFVQGDSTMIDSLQTTLRKLRLSGLAQTLDVRLQEAAGHNLNHLEFLELILQDELFVRDQRRINRRMNAAALRALRPLDQFYWSFNPSLPR